MTPAPETPAAVDAGVGWYRRHLGRIGSMARGRSFSDGAWLIAGQALTAVTLLVGVRLLTGKLSPEAFGEVSLIIGLLTLGRNIFCFPFNQAALRYYAESVRSGRVTGFRSVLVGFCTRAAVILTGLVVVAGVTFCLRTSTTLWLVPLMVMFLVTDIFRTMETDLFNAARRQRIFVTVRAGEAAFRNLAAVLAVYWLWPDPVAVFIGYTVSGVGFYLALFVFNVETVGTARATAAVAGGEGADDFRSKFWRFGLPLVPLAILEWVSNLGDRYLIGGLIGLDVAGIYVAAYGLVNQPFQIVQGLLEQLLRPRYFEAVAAGDRRESRRTLATWVGVNLAVCVTGVVLVTVLREPITALLLGPKYRSAASFLPWIAAGNAMLAVGMVFEKLAYAANRTGVVLVGRAIGAAMSVIVVVPMVFAFGVSGAAWSMPIYYGAQLLYTVLATRRLEVVQS